MQTPSLTSFQQADAEARDDAMRLATRLEDAYRPVIAKLVRDAAKNLRSRTRVLTADAGWSLPDADELMNRLALELELSKRGDPIRVLAMEMMVGGVATRLGVNLSLHNPLIEGVLELQGQKITRIAESLRADVMAVIADAWERGLSIPDTAALVTEQAVDFSTSRAEMIARTEILGVSNMGSLAAAQMTGAAPYKQWLATLDNRTRPWHAEMDGETVGINDVFSNGLSAPGDPAGDAAEVVNCRCTIIYSDQAAGADLSGREDLRASGAAMAESSDTLATMTVSYQGEDYVVIEGASADDLRELNPGISDETAENLAALALTAAASGSTSLPLGARDETWDAAAAEAAMDGADQLAMMHFWKDPEGDPAVKSSYKLPFATPDPETHAVWAGVTACAAACQGARGGVDIPDADMAGVRSKIEAYYTKAKAEFDDPSIEVPWASSTAAADPGTVEADLPPVSGAPAASGWSADPLIPYGVPTRDGRMIRAGALAVPAEMPVPLMAMLEEVHGPSMTLPVSKLVGAITAFDDSGARLAASGTIDDTPDGQAALQAVGRMGISADLAVSEYEFVVTQDTLDAMDGDMPDAADMPASQDVEGGVVIEAGDQADMGMFVVTRGEVMGATIVPFAAFDEARIELTSLAADGHPTHARVVMPLRLVAAVEGDTIGDAPEGARTPATPLRSDVDVLPALDAIIAAQRSASGIAPLEALAAAMRAGRGEAPRPQVDAEVVVALIDAVGRASHDPGLSDLAAALAASAARPPEPAAPIVVNPPPVTVHTPDVKVENHQPEIHVQTASGKRRPLLVTRDDQGNAVRFEEEGDD